jgi:hypothetical protein
MSNLRNGTGFEFIVGINPITTSGTLDKIDSTFYILIFSINVDVSAYKMV